MNLLEKIEDKAFGSVDEARRVNIDHGHGRMTSFSIPGGVLGGQTLRAVQRVQVNIARGHARRIHRIDGPPHPRYRITAYGFVPLSRPSLRDWTRYIVGVSRTYVAMWTTIVVRATIERAKTEREVARIRASFDNAILSPIGRPDPEYRP